jgi:putative transposase
LGTSSWLSPQEQSSYAKFVRTEDEEADNAIRIATKTGRPFGSESFIDILKFRLNQSLKPGKQGRPRAKTEECA